MFSDTLTVTIDTVDKVLVRINQDGYASEYLLRETDREFRLKIRNTSYVRKGDNVKVDRHTMELTEVVFPITAGDAAIKRKTYSVFENDAGDDITDVTSFVVAFNTFLGNGYRIGKMLNWES